MEHLPPVGWADVATKTDLQVLRSDLHALEQRIGAQLSDLRADFQRDLRTTMIAVMAGNAAVVAAVVSTVSALTRAF